MMAVCPGDRVLKNCKGLHGYTWTERGVVVSVDGAGLVLYRREDGRLRASFESDLQRAKETQ